MQRLLPVCLVAWLAVSPPLAAGPVESAIVAIMRLGEKPSYSWVTTVTDDARTYDIEGRTARAGFTRVRMPVVNSLRRRLGRSVTDTQVELVFRGNVDCVIATEQGWRRPDDLPHVGEEEEPDLSGGPLAATVPGGGIVSGGGVGGTVRPRRARSRERDERNYSNLQLGLSHPHEELAVIVSSHQDLVVEGDAVSGTLTDLGAQLLLVRDGQKEIAPLRASGRFKLWLRDGLVAKYHVRLEGVIEVDTGKGRRRIEVNQSAETIVKDVGTTVFDVPEEARRQLAR